MNSITRLLVAIFILFLLLTQLVIVRAQSNFPVKKLNVRDDIPGYDLKSIQLPNGIHLEYAEKGSSSAIPVIFLHGFTDSWHSFEHVLPLLPQSIHAFALSQRGHGNSERPEKEYTPGHFASDIAVFMERLKIESAIIVGHSMSGTIAQRFALDYPHKTKALVLISAFVSYTANPAIGELLKVVSTIKDPVDSTFVYEFQKSTLFLPIGESAMKTYVEESMKLPSRVWKDVAEQVLTVDYSQAVKQITSPTLILWGDKDTFCPEADQYILKNEIKRSTLLIYKGVGHAIHWEKPNRFTNDLIRFIEKNLANTEVPKQIDFIDEIRSGIYY